VIEAYTKSLLEFISRLQRLRPWQGYAFPGALPQAFTFRAVGALCKNFGYVGWSLRTHSQGAILHQVIQQSVRRLEPRVR
jgi:hypothetical protein